MSTRNILHGYHRFQCLKLFFSRMFHLSGIVVLSFFVCWAPFHAQRLGYIYFGGLDTSIPGNLILVETFYDVNETLM